MSSFKKIFNHVLSSGRVSSPRGQKTLEVENALCTFLPYERFATFPSRKLSLAYIKTELLWYLKGDMYDLSICDHAKIWREMVTDEGKLNSNYGYAVFTRCGIDYVAECLKKDKDSRRAMISIMGRSHLYEGCRDVPCTVSMGFRIRDNVLRTTVHMRSTDLIFGMGNDIPFFSFVAECLLVYLLGTYPDLELGDLVLFSESLHVYERHFEMLAKLVNEEPEPVWCPRLHSADEIKLLRAGQALPSDKHQFSGWLLAKDQKKEKAP
jgi:thymidylate synthase